MNALLGKIIIEGKLLLESGLHIGTSNEFAAIGAVDNPVIRDTATKQPYIPGSSLKGKMRFLMARVASPNGQIPRIASPEEGAVINRLFGSHTQSIASRLQFYDLFMEEETVGRLKILARDSFLTEIKNENTINRKTAVANPRQMERIPRGASFNFKLVYNIENIEELTEDWQHILKAFELLQEDYLGGSGSRGYGRLRFQKMQRTIQCYNEEYRQRIEALNLSI